MIKAVLFDMDGVIYDSLPSHVRAWSEMAQKYDLVLAPNDIYLWEGRIGSSIINKLYQATYGHDATQQEINDLYAEKARLFSKYFNGQIIEGIRDVLENVKKLNLDMLIVTGSGQHGLIDKVTADFDGYFNRTKMITSFDVKVGKPHPEPYLTALRKAGVEACEAIVVENAPLGVQSAVAAGIYTIAVNTGPLPDDMLFEAGADVLYHDMPSLANHIAHIVEYLNTPQDA
ncbi:MAG: HAD-IA family hydrolase [Tannerellaceae bacterium]|jgi:HAD superfamily hydrolase (TIGR01509 family)|nr:HAD-IA family hydrolase [Tannerellaceae bacterium]